METQFPKWAVSVKTGTAILFLLFTHCYKFADIVKY
jgi:hypothetical protein